MNETEQIAEQNRIGNRIAEIRELKGLSQQQLSELSEITLSNISRIESGKYSVTLKTLCKIAKVLGVTVDFVD